MKKKSVEEPAVLHSPEITSLDQPDLSERHSYADYFRWKFRERVELIRGFIYKISPAPDSAHQKAVKKLVLKIGVFLENKSGEMFSAPFDVRLPDSEKQTDDQAVHTVVQPDICVICDQSKIDSRGCIGAPDLVVEILSPGNSTKEMGIKFDLYEEKGIKEYWLADTENRAILVYVLRDGKYIGLKPFTEENVITSLLFPELKFVVKEVFEQ